MTRAKMRIAEDFYLRLIRAGAEKDKDGTIYYKRKHMKSLPDWAQYCLSGLPAEGKVDRNGFVYTEEGKPLYS